MNSPLNLDMCVFTARVREILKYDPETGAFVRLVKTSNCIKVGSVAGWPDKDGYLKINIDGHGYMAHRLAWLYVYGSWPSSNLDHINQVKDDNRLVNLREVTVSQNQQNTPIRTNNKSGFRGVSFAKEIGRWRAGIRLNGKGYHLGYFGSPEDASVAYQSAASKMHTHQPGDAARKGGAS